LTQVRCAPRTAACTAVCCSLLRHFLYTSFILLPSCNTAETTPHDAESCVVLRVRNAMVTASTGPMLAGTPQQPPASHHRSIRRVVVLAQHNTQQSK
jgi:hypothetical protein